MTVRVKLTVAGSDAGLQEVDLSAGNSREISMDLMVPQVGDHELSATVSVGYEEYDRATTVLSVERYPTSFVGTDGTDFTVDGSSFRYRGVNLNNLSVKRWGTEHVDALLDYVAEHDVSVVRTWFFPPGWTGTQVHLGPDEFDDSWFDHFDYIVLAAKRRGIRLVLPLLMNWYGPDLAPSPAAYADWSSTADSHNEFFDDEQANAYYHNYIERFLTRENQLTGLSYHEDPTIMAWEVGNEVEYLDDRRGESLADWYDSAARHIRSLDDHHLIGTGMHGATGDVYESWNRRNAYVETHQSDAIDVCSFHEYPVARHGDSTTVRSAEEFGEYVRSHVRKAHEEVGKPAYLGEFGVVVDPEDDLPLSQRNELFKTANRVGREAGLGGIQYWYPELSSWDGDERTRTENPLGIFAEDTSTWEVIENGIGSGESATAKTANTR